MLIDLPIEDIKEYLYDFGKLYQKIGEAIANIQGIPKAPLADLDPVVANYN
jgi:hypothetical protein